MSDTIRVRVLAVDLRNSPAVQVQMANTVRMGSRTVEKLYLLLLGGPNQDALPSI